MPVQVCTKLFKSLQHLLKHGNEFISEKDHIFTLCVRTRILVIGESGGEFSDDSFILEKQLTVTNISKK